MATNLAYRFEEPAYEHPDDGLGCKEQKISVQNQQSLQERAAQESEVVEPCIEENAPASKPKETKVAKVPLQAEFPVGVRVWAGLGIVLLIGCFVAAIVAPGIASPILGLVGALILIPSLEVAEKIYYCQVYNAGTSN